MIVSIATVCLNGATDLALTIESVLAQDYPQIELVIVDGGSWDATADVLARYRQDIDRIVSINDAGIFDAMNRSVECCTGEYVLFLNAGDRFFDFDAVSKVMAARAGSPDVMFGDHVYLHGRQEMLHKGRPFRSTREDLRSGLVSHAWHSAIPCHQATFTRTRLLRELGYDTRLEICADHDFLFRAYDRGASFQYVDEVVCHYLGGGYSARRLKRYKQEIASVYRRFSNDPSAVDELFFPDGDAPFARESAATGVRLGGFFPPEPASFDVPSSFAWCSGQGFSLLSPVDSFSNACVLEGSTPFYDQALVVALDNRPIGRIDVPYGDFVVKIGFDQAVPNGSVVQFSPTQYGEIAAFDRRVVSLSLTAVRFLPISRSVISSLARHQVVPMNVDNAVMIEQWCVAGWSVPEQDHIWSIGDQSQIMLRADEDVEAVVLRVLPNPAAGANMREVTYGVNGDNKVIEIAPDGTDLVIDCAATSWRRSDVNVIMLRPSIAVSPSRDDLRRLGVCLKEIRAN